MMLSKLQGLYISINKPAEENDLALTITIVNEEDESASFEVSTNQSDLQQFAQRLKTFPKDTYDIVEISWISGKQLLPEKTIETGRLRLLTKVITSTGYSELKLEILETKKFIPGIKYSISIGTLPIKINQLGLSLETWANHTTNDFSFPL
jgi:hypothetical protein